MIWGNITDFQEAWDPCQEKDNYFFFYVISFHRSSQKPGRTLYTSGMSILSMEGTNPRFQQNPIPVTADEKIFSTGSLGSLGVLLNITRSFNVTSSNLSYMD